MKNSLRKTFYFLLIPIITIIIGHCGGDCSVNAPQDFVSGTVTFNNASLYYSGGYYAVTIYYADSANPFHHTPVKSDSLLIGTSNRVTTAYYNINGLNGNYYIGATWIRHSNGHISVLGAYGCDTTINCTTSTKVIVPNYAGDCGLDFKSYTNITRNISVSLITEKITVLIV